ncbi:PfkB family carbohydrate kinase, partial [Amycolatopsis sp. SID8362]|uniref:carbohydrate kinase family protein n=1 Tax=Amycolatopsis sp. SID8362 TaxID=2690346 RepID=UPI00136977E9
RTAGAIGTDPVGDLLLAMLARHGVDTSLVVRRDGVQTSASVLPIRADGSRPAFHVPGANLTYEPSDAPVPEIARATHLHLGGPELMGGEKAAKILAPARAAGVVTSADLLAPGDPGVLAWLAPALSALDYLLPNEEQLLGLTKAATLEAGAHALLDAGVGGVAVTRGARGALVVTAAETIAVPAFDVPVVDTTGCGDAFSAGFLRGLGLGRSLRDAAVLGSAAAALVAQGLGSDHGDFDLAAADTFAEVTPTLA